MTGMSPVVPPLWSSEFISAPRTLDDIADSLLVELNKLGFEHFVYSGVPFMFSHDMTAPPDVRVFDFRHVSTCKTSIASNPQSLSGLKQYLKNFAHDCPDFRRTIRVNDVHIHPGPPAAANRADCMGYSDEVHSIATLHMRDFCSGYWGGMFRLYSPMDTRELELHLNKVRPELYHFLNMAHLECMAHHRDRFNPYLNMGVFCNKALNTLKLTAQGYCTREIGLKLDLSDRGVDYHIEKMRVKLKARNRMHLIAIASQVGMVH